MQLMLVPLLVLLLVLVAGQGFAERLMRMKCMDRRLVEGAERVLVCVLAAYECRECACCSKLRCYDTA